jgi:hypothetical protein
MARIRFIARFVALPLALLLLTLKLTGWLELPWLLVLLPCAFYALHPVIIGVLGPVLQHRRYQRCVDATRGRS